MNATCHGPAGERKTTFELRFDSLFQPGRALSFPCDAAGRVDLDALGERARCNYFFARAVTGRDYAHPTVIGMTTGHGNGNGARALH